MMKRYSLCSRDARENFDLREVEGDIRKVILSVKPDAIIRVEEDCYYTDLNRGEAIRVGKTMSKIFPDSAHEMARKLFKGQKI